MPTKRERPSRSDWPRVDATTDEEIAARIAADPDTAPDMTDAISARTGRTQPPDIDRNQ